MKYIVCLILGCAVWFAAAQASASIAADIDSNTDFITVGGTIYFSCADSTPYEEIAWVDWDWNNDGIYDESGVWPDDAEKSHQWTTAGIYYVTVRVSNYDHSDSDTATSVKLCVADPAIVVDRYCIEINTDVGFDATDCSLPDTVNKTYQWDFTGDGRPDSISGTDTWSFDEVGWHVIQVWVAYDNNPMWKASEWAYIYVNVENYCP